MHSNTICKDCQLEIKEYKQLIQQDKDLCEFCAISNEGEIEFPDTCQLDSRASTQDLLEDDF